MKEFMCDDFLLSNDTAKKLYHDYAKKMPIIDYHNHLIPSEIYENKSYRNLTDIWLGGDHYKWRGMRSNGVAEEYITGDKPDYDKFTKWAETVPYTLGNPLYHWTHLELKRCFGIDEVLSPKTADDIWDRANDKLKSNEFKPREIIANSNVEVICTTDDPVDNLEYHIKLKDEEDRFKMLPTFRPDRAIDIEKGDFADYIKLLKDVVDYKINSIDMLKKALTDRIDFFDNMGCGLSDHSLSVVMFEECTDTEAGAIFEKKIAGNELCTEEIAKYKTNVLSFLGREYYKRNWAMQLHIGALRDNNSRLLNSIGNNIGCDSIDDREVAYPLSRLLDALDKTNQLSKTILYPLNPRDNYVIGSMIGNFQDGSMPGKIQFGSGWWFNDQRDGMVEQMKALSNLGLITRFIGMLTDSRSLLSFPRHEYFRRILCNFIGEMVEDGEYPNDLDFLGKIVEGICYYNVKGYLNL